MQCGEDMSKWQSTYPTFLARSLLSDLHPISIRSPSDLHPISIRPPSDLPVRPFLQDNAIKLSIGFGILLMLEFMMLANTWRRVECTRRVTWRRVTWRRVKRRMWRVDAQSPTRQRTNLLATRCRTITMLANTRRLIAHTAAVAVRFVRASIRACVYSCVVSPARCHRPSQAPSLDPPHQRRPRLRGRRVHAWRLGPRRLGAHVPGRPPVRPTAAGRPGQVHGLHVVAPFASHGRFVGACTRHLRGLLHQAR